MNISIHIYSCFYTILHQYYMFYYICSFVSWIYIWFLIIICTCYSQKLIYSHPNNWSNQKMTKKNPFASHWRDIGILMKPFYMHIYIYSWIQICFHVFQVPPYLKCELFINIISQNFPTSVIFKISHLDFGIIEFFSVWIRNKFIMFGQSYSC